MCNIYSVRVYILMFICIYTSVYVDPRIMPIKGYSSFHKVPGQRSQHQMQFTVISRTLVGGGFTLLKRCSLHILQPQPTGLGACSDHLWWLFNHLTVCKQIQVQLLVLHGNTRKCANKTIRVSNIWNHLAVYK